MLRGNRSAILATLGVAVFAAFFWFLVIDLRAVHSGIEERAAYNANKYTANANDKIGRSCVKLAPVEQLKCTEEAEQAARENQREEYDLAAQQTTSWWTQVMGVAALIGMALSAIGVALVWRTFREQKRTNDLAHADAERSRIDARESAKSAAEAIRIAQDNAESTKAQVAVAQGTAKDQLRAYVGIESLAVGRTPGVGMDHFIVMLKNSGATPASGVSVIPFVGIGPEDAKMTDIGWRRENRLPRLVLPPGQTMTIPARLDGDERQRVWSFRKAEGIPFAKLIVSYGDIYGRIHRFVAYISSEPNQSVKGEAGVVEYHAEKSRDTRKG